MAEFLGIPYKTYQKVEQGNLPQKATMAAITKKLGESELSMVQVAGLKAPEAAPELADLMAELREIKSHVAKRPPEPRRPESLKTFNTIIEYLTALEEPELLAIKNYIEMIKGRPQKSIAASDPFIRDAIALLGGIHKTKHAATLAALRTLVQNNVAKGDKLG